MRYELILFDLDDTLFDFGRSQLHAFGAVLADQNQGELSSTHFSKFQEINLALWKAFERGVVKKEHVKRERFHLFAQEFKLTLCPDRASKTFLRALCEKTFLMDNALEVRQALRGKTKIGIVTNGIAEVQWKRLAGSPSRRTVTSWSSLRNAAFKNPSPEFSSTP